MDIQRPASVAKQKKIRRIGFARWQRNIAVALGNAPAGDASVLACLHRHRDSPSPLVREHVEWALASTQPLLMKNNYSYCNLCNS